MKIAIVVIIIVISLSGCSKNPQNNDYEPVDLTPLELPITHLNVWDIAVRDSILFVVSYGEDDYWRRGLYICNAIDPTEPVIIETLAVNTKSIALDDSVIFIGGIRSWVYSVDIREILDINTLDTLTDFYYLFVADYADGFLYVVDRLHGLYVIDASDPADLSIASNAPTPGGYARNVDVAGVYAYVASGAAGVYIFDISDPYSPEEVGQYDTPGYCWSVAIDTGANILYIADEFNGALVLDVSDPSSPEKVGEWSISGSKLIYVEMHGDLPVFIEEDYGLRVLYYNGENTIELGHAEVTSGDPRTICSYGDYVFVGTSDTLYLIDLTPARNNIP